MQAVNRLVTDDELGTMGKSGAGVDAGDVDRR